LEPNAGLSVSMRNSNMIFSDLSASGPSTFSIYFTLETKELEAITLTWGGKEKEDLENLLMAILWIDFFNRSVVTVFYAERKIAIYDLF
jgi:hypothetical protein